jgi:predicted nucleic acid-binding protein
MREPWSLPGSIVIDTGPLLLPLTRELGWDRVRKLLAMHEKGEIHLYIGMFNLAEIVYAAYRLGYSLETSMRYASLVSEKLGIINDARYAMLMGRLRLEAHRHNYNIPWGDISSAAAALSLGTPVLVLDEDTNFTKIAAISNKLGYTIEVIRVKDLA